jgi:hypothetical protein
VVLRGSKVSKVVNSVSMVCQGRQWCVKWGQKLSRTSKAVKGGQGRQKCVNGTSMMLMEVKGVNATNAVKDVKGAEGCSGCPGCQDQ